MFDFLFDCYGNIHNDLASLSPFFMYVTLHILSYVWVVSLCVVHFIKYLYSRLLSATEWKIDDRDIFHVNKFVYILINKKNFLKIFRIFPWCWVRFDHLYVDYGQRDLLATTRMVMGCKFSLGLRFYLFLFIFIYYGIGWG